MGQRTVATNKGREFLRRRAPLPANGVSGASQIVDLSAADPFWEVEYRKHLVTRALTIMQSDFQPATWQACWEHVVNGKPAAQVAKELGIAEGTVYVAKSRVLHRLREELAGLLE